MHGLGVLGWPRVGLALTPACVVCVICGRAVQKAMQTEVWVREYESLDKSELNRRQRCATPTHTHARVEACACGLTDQFRVVPPTASCTC
jgi:hypothetical protein